MNEIFLQAETLWLREIVRFIRQPIRVMSAIATPLVFWLLLGAGLQASFKPSGMPAGVDYVQYFYPGVIVLMLLFTAIFATASTGPGIPLPPILHTAILHIIVTNHGFRSGRILCVSNSSTSRGSRSSASSPPGAPRRSAPARIGARSPTSTPGRARGRAPVRIPLDSATCSEALGHPFRSTRPRSERSDGIWILRCPPLGARDAWRISPSLPCSSLRALSFS